MYNVLCITHDTDYDIIKQEVLTFNSLEELKSAFHITYVKQLLSKGRFKLNYHTYGDPRDADTWNGYELYMLIE